MTRRSEVLGRLEPGPVLGLAAADMRRLGLDEGERVRLVSRHVAIELPVRTKPGLQPHTAFLPFAFRQAAANLLTGAALDPLAKIPDSKHCPLRLERIPATERVHA